MSIFTQVKNRKVGSNTFDLSHDKKMSLKMGQLVPIHCQEIIPGDTINMSTSQMLRMAPMITPIMHKINVYTHFFFVFCYVIHIVICFNFFVFEVFALIVGNI
jgi:hypothetical protein